MNEDDKSRQTERALLVFTLFVFVVIAAAVSFLLVRSYRITVERLTDRAQAASATVATHTEWIDALARQALRRIDYTLGDEVLSGSPGNVADLRKAVDGLPVQTLAYVVDETGQLLYSTDPAARLAGVTDGELFKSLVSGPKEAASALIVSPQDAQQYFAFGRRLERAGRLEGIAIVSFPAALLEPVWQALDLGPGSTIGIIRRDGQLVARFPYPKGPLDLSKYVLFTDYLKRGPRGTYEAVSPADGETRLVGYRTVPGTDFVVQASAGMEVGLRRFWTFAYATLALTAGVGVGVALGYYSIYRLIQRDARNSARLQTALDNNRLLLREIHHRVKNNLQSVQGLIRLQRLPRESQEALLDRLAAMAKVHEIIYRNDAFDRIPANTLLRSVVESLVQSHNPGVAVTFDLDPLPIDTDLATSLASLVVELVTNALKYAFAAVETPHLFVSLKSLSENRARLVVRDNGVGFDPSTVQRGIGSSLIDGTVKRMSGTHQFENDGGTVFSAELDLGDPTTAQTPGPV